MLSKWHRYKVSETEHAIKSHFVGKVGVGVLKVNQMVLFVSRLSKVCMCNIPGRVRGVLLELSERVFGDVEISQMPICLSKFVTRTFLLYLKNG